jgi:DNA polymerase-3 subunit epsilon
VVSIAVIDSNGRTLLDTLVKPVGHITHAATEVHGINDEMVATAPRWIFVQDALHEILWKRNIITFNAKFDREMLLKSAEQAKCSPLAWLSVCDWHCAMQAYAEFYGEPGYGSQYKWKSLDHAASHFGIARNGHNALGDSLATLAVVNALIGVADEVQS